MNVKRIDFKTHTVSIGISNQYSKPTIRKEFLDNPMLNILHPREGNPVVEDLMDKVVLNRSISLDDGIETLIAIKEKAPFLTKYIDSCINELKTYYNKV